MQESRLAAIMFTDIVGYTALMGADEDRAFEVLHQNREIHTILISQFSGTLIKEMGEGILAQFNSAINAVRCSIEIQKQTKEAFREKIRIGIHLGDVTFENNDVFGDGVNISSRLQAITDPGGIYVSESLQKAIRAKSEIKTRYLGEFRLKNVDYPVKTYSIQGEGLPITSPIKIKKLSGKSLKDRIFGSVLSYIVFLFLLVSIGWWIRNQFLTNKSDISSLLVLPVNNYTGSDTLEYFVAGMHNAMIWDIGKIGALQVKSTTTSRAYKETKKTIPEIASELNVDALVEPSVICLGDSICLQVKLVSAQEDQLWIKDYKVAKNQILNLYNLVSKEISEEIDVILTPHEETLLAETRSVDNDAYDAYLKGQFLLDQINEASLKKAITYFNIAIKIEPDWAAPYAGLAEVGSYQNQMGFGESYSTTQMIKENLKIALELDPNSANSHYINAVIAIWTEWNWEKGEREFLKALELNPSNASCRMFYAHLLTILRRTDEALQHGRIAMQNDPLNAFNLGLYAAVLFYSGNCQDAIVYAEKGLAIEPDHHFTIGIMREASVCIKDYERAFEIIKHFNYTLWQEYKVAASLENIFHEHGWATFIEELIRINEEVWVNDGHLHPWVQASKYMSIEKYGKALDYYEIIYTKHSPNLPYISAKPTFDEMKDNPRYIDLLKKMNLPVD